MQTRAHTVAAWCIRWNCSSLAVPTSTGKTVSSTERVWKHPVSHTKLVFFSFFSSAQRTQPSLGQLPTSPQRLVSQERKREQEQAAGGGQMCSERIHCLGSPWSWGVAAPWGPAALLLIPGVFLGFPDLPTAPIWYEHTLKWRGTGGLYPSQTKNWVQAHVQGCRGEVASLPVPFARGVQQNQKGKVLQEEINLFILASLLRAKWWFDAVRFTCGEQTSCGREQVGKDLTTA